MATRRTVRNIDQVYALIDAKLSLAERETRAGRAEEAIALIRAARDRCPLGTGLARSLLDDAVLELALRIREMRGEA